jgi:hypothetical protein
MFRYLFVGKQTSSALSLQQVTGKVRGECPVR